MLASYLLSRTVDFRPLVMFHHGAGTSIALRRRSHSWDDSSAASNVSLKTSAVATNSYWKPPSSIVAFSWSVSWPFVCSSPRAIHVPGARLLPAGGCGSAAFACASPSRPTCGRKRRALVDQIEAALPPGDSKMVNCRRYSITSACLTPVFNQSYSSNGTIGTSDAEILIAP